MKPKKTLLLLLAMFSSALWSQSTYRVDIGGIPVHCEDHTGRPVLFVPNYQLQDVGRALPSHNPMQPPIIELNPNVLASLSLRMQLFWYAHECAHHAIGNDEILADCWAVRRMRDQGYLAPWQVPELQQQIVHTSGSIWGHLPGPLRAQHFGRCYYSY